MTFIPPVPTDNLYKFVTLAGLVVCGASQFYYWQQFDGNQLFRISAAQNLMEVNSSVQQVQQPFQKHALLAKLFIVKDIRTLDESIFDATSQSERDKVRKQFQLMRSELQTVGARLEEELDFKFLEERRGTAYSVEEQAKATAELKSRFGSAGQQLQDLIPTVLKVEATTMEYWHRQDNLARIQKATHPFTIGGLIAAGLGALLWFLLVQRHQDKVLRQQAQQSK